MAGAWCARQFADFGADVVLVEATDGHALRKLAPFGPDGTSILARYVHAGKRSLALDRSGAEDRETLGWLAATCDIVIDSYSSGSLGAWGLNFEALQRSRPEAILVSVTPNGLTGARAGWPGSDLTDFALSGHGFVGGIASREPLKGSGFVASYNAGTAAYCAAMTALFHRDGGGGGQQVDVAEADALAATAGHALLLSQYQGVLPTRSSPAQAQQRHPRAVRDGHIWIGLATGDRWREGMIALGLTELADDDRLATREGREAHQEVIESAMRAKLGASDKMELFESLGRMLVRSGPALHIDELMRNDHLHEREFFVRAADDPDGPQYPGPPARLSRSPWSLRSSVPTVGQHSAEILDEVATRGDEPAAAPTGWRRQGELEGGGPLVGVRAVVLTQAWAGSFATELLAFMGADVVQIEARGRPDVERHAYWDEMPRALVDVPTAQHPWNCIPAYNWVNLNKQGVTIDLRSSDGMKMFRRMVAEADIVAENFAPRVMGSLGIDYEVLRKIKPNLIMCSISAYGASGPYRDYIGNGWTIEPSSGMSSLLGYPDGPPLNSGTMYSDLVSAYNAAAAMLTALHHRNRTGEGQLIDLSMQESNATFIGDAILEYSLNGDVRGRQGNRHLTFAPHGFYPARGEQQWVAIAAESEEQWRALCEVAEQPRWAEDPRFADNELRKANEDALDALIVAWTVGQLRDAVAERLARAGVPAAPVLDAREVAADAVFRERGVVVDLDHPETGRQAHTAVPFRFSRTPAVATSASPTLGQHSAEVFARLLGIDSEEYNDLVRSGVTGTGPPDE
jgi:crotonobetainyl-CoA:carnitine CoA-transferase CaiB-like acyl-CoA transferase